MSVTGGAGLAEDQRGYRVRLDNFEGPLDLLLYLIKREEMNIYDIPIARITEQYLEYITDLAELDFDRAAEYLVIAATLVRIKSRMLLPKPPTPPPEEELGEEDPRAELVRQLVAYSRYREAAQVLREMEEHQRRLYARSGPLALDGWRPLSGVSVEDLALAFQEILAQSWRFHEVPEREIPLREKIREIAWRLKRGPQGIRFRDLFGERISRLEMVVTFLALLELIRRRQAVAEQSELFGEIIIRRPEAPAEDGAV